MIRLKKQGIEKSDKIKTKEKIKEKNKTKEKIKEKNKTKEKVKEKNKTKEEVIDRSKSMNKGYQKEKEKEIKNNFYSEIRSTFKNKEFIEKFNQKYISKILENISSSAKESHLNPNLKNSLLWDYINWLDKGYQKDYISSEIGRKLNQKNPRHENMPIFVEGSPRNLIKTAFDLPNGKNWQKTFDYQIKNYLISNYQKIKNPFSATQISSNNSYRRKISVSSKTGMVGISKPSKISPEFPISVLMNSKTTNSEIYKLFPSEIQSQESLMYNTIPYKFLMDLRVQIKILSGNLNVAMEPNFQFHSDKNIHNKLKSSWFQRLSTLLRITIQSINRMKVTLSFGGYGKKQYPIWNAMDWLLEIIDEKGKLNEKHIYKTENDGGVTVYEYYKVLHNIASAISKEYSPAHAKLIIKSLLPKHLNKSLLNIKIKERFALEQVLNDILANWNKGLDADSFKTKYGQASELWNIFTSRSDLDTAIYFASILQKIAYISRCSSSDTNPNLKKSKKMFGFTSVLYPTLKKLIELYSPSGNYDFLKGKTPLNDIIQSADSQAPFSIVALADNLFEILSTPWKLIQNPISVSDQKSLFNKLTEYIHTRGESVYNPNAMKTVNNIWTNSLDNSLFIREMDQAKPYFGKIGENNLVKIRTAGKFYWLNQYISDFEHDFITSRCTIVKDDPMAVYQLKPGYKFLAAGETLEKGKLPKNLEVSRMSKGKVKKSFLDNAIGFQNNFLITKELYGYKRISYRNDKNFGALSWIENGYFTVYSPYTDLTRPSKAKRIKEFVMKTDVEHPDKTKYIGKISPFTDSITQANSLYDLYAQILANIDKNLRFDDFLTQLRIPENITKWQIPSALNKNLKDTISWINRIHWIHGIRVNPFKNFEFDYIMNTPPNNPYNLKPDPNYQKFSDPFTPNYDPKTVSDYIHKFKYSSALKITNSTYKNQKTLSYYYKWFNNLKKFINIQDNLSKFVEDPANKSDLYAKLAHFLIFQKFAGLNKKTPSKISQKKKSGEK